MDIQMMKRVTVIAEAVVAERIEEDILELGATGYTTTEADGRGSRGVRASDWEGKNVKIESVVTPHIAGKILECLAKDYFPNFAVIAYAHDVEVVRGDKYA